VETLVDLPVPRRRALAVALPQRIRSRGRPSSMRSGRAHDPVPGHRGARGQVDGGHVGSDRSSRGLGQAHEHGGADDLRHAPGGFDADREQRDLGEPSDEVLLRMVALRQQGRLMRLDQRGEQEHIRAHVGGRQDLDNEHPCEEADDRRDLISDERAEANSQRGPERRHHDRANQQPSHVAGIEEQSVATAADQRSASPEREARAERAEADPDKDARE
jgi:hypothetical protein